MACCSSAAQFEHKDIIFKLRIKSSLEIVCVLDIYSHFQLSKICNHVLYTIKEANKRVCRKGEVASISSR